MKKTSTTLFKPLLIFLIVTGLLQSNICYAQISQDSIAKAAILGTFAIGESMRAEKLKNQNAALRDIKSAFEALKQGDTMNGLNHALYAIKNFPRFSTPYLLAAFASLQQNKPLDAHRYLAMYDKVKDRSENKELDKDIPSSFTSELRQQIQTEFDKMTPQTLSAIYQQENWKNMSLDLSVAGNLNSYGDTYVSGTNNNSDFDMDYPIDFLLSYSHYFWLNKAKAFPTSVKNNIGIQLMAGFDYRYSIGSAMPSRKQFFLTPGVYLGKFYVAPFKLFGGSFDHYSKDDPNGENSFVSILPEMRFYMTLSQYATKGRSTASFKDPTIGNNAMYMYIYLRTDGIVYNGSNTAQVATGTTTNSVKTTFELNNNSYMAGFAIGANRFEFSFGLGVENFSLYSIKDNGKTYTTNYNIDVTPFTAQMALSYRIL